MWANGTYIRLCKYYAIMSAIKSLFYKGDDMIVYFGIGMIILTIFVCIFSPSIRQRLFQPGIIVYPELIYTVFWTGGYDSTFTILHLLQYGNVQPVYITGCIDDDDGECRKSRKQELAAMKTIRQIIQSSVSLNHTLLPTHYVDTLKLDKDIKKAAREAYMMGQGTRAINQYTYMAQYCKNYKTIGYVSIERSPGTYWEILSLMDRGTTHCRNKTVSLYKQFRFPCIHLSKQDMYKLTSNKAILQKTWSCWYPNNGVPCGECEMCRDRIV
jgi:hypothetical protein